MTYSTRIDLPGIRFFRPSGAGWHALTLTHGLRRGLHSLFLRRFAASSDYSPGSYERITRPAVTSELLAGRLRGLGLAVVCKQIQPAMYAGGLTGWGPKFIL
jgi:hypothetical protein